MANAALITHPGFEDIALAEVKDLIGVKATTAAAGIVTFSPKNLVDLCRLCYLSQSTSSVFLLSPGVSAEMTVAHGIKLNAFDLGSREYAVFGRHDDLSGNVAYLLLRAAGYDGKKSLFDPFTRSGAIAIEAALFSSGFPVNHYRKDPLKFSRLKPFSNIDFDEFFAVAEKEAAAAAKKRSKGVKPKILSSSPLMQNVRFAEKNAKIAGVNKLIRFSRLDMAWLDAKLDEHSIDLVVSYPPQFKSIGVDMGHAGVDKGFPLIATAENNKLQKMYKNFFYQADFFLKNSGEVVLLLKSGWNNVAAAASNYKFKPKVLRKFGLGSYELELVSFSK